MRQRNSGCETRRYAEARPLLPACAQLQLGAELAKQGKRTAAGGVYKVGKPYKIAGEWYYPRENTKYDNIGIASWYGPKFQGRRTAMAKFLI